MRSIQLRVFCYFALFSASGLSADAADVLLKRTCRVRGPIVRLGDIADVFSADADEAERLSQTELFPTPATRQLIEFNEIRRLLALRSVNLADCRFRGAATIELTTAREATVWKTASRQQTLNRGQIEIAGRRTEEAIHEYLRTSTSPEQAWEVAVELDEASTQAVLQRNAQLSIEGGQAPQVGRQRFTLVVKTGEKVDKLSVAADLSLRDMIVVARRPLSRGQLISASDVELQPKPQQGVVRDPVLVVADVVGKEVARAVSTGRPLEANYIQAPRLVLQNDIVTVYSIAGGVSVRTVGKALEEGAAGDVISVVDVKTRKPFRAKARVVAFQTVEIYALGPTTGRRRGLATKEIER